MKFRLLSEAVLCVILLASCSNENDRKPILATTIPPIQTLVKEIAGDSFEVFSLLDSSSDPESYEPSLHDMKSLNDAAIYFLNGTLPMENNIAERFSSSFHAPKMVKLSQEVGIIMGTHNNCSAHHHHHRYEIHGDYENSLDPHIWSSYRNMRKFARKIFEELSSKYPEKQDIFAKNYAIVAERLDSLDRIAISLLENDDDIAFLIDHPSLSYFASDYNLIQLPIGMENKESSLQEMVGAMQKAKRYNTKILVLEDESAERTAQNIKNQLNIESVVFKQLDPDWETQLNIIVDAIAR